MVPERLKYRAFLSYSHRDKQLGEWLHSALERYQIPHDLRGKQSQHGTVPQSLRPVFRDRDDLEAGHSLHEQVQAALAESEALVIMCSPDSAKSPYVNEEIRRFKALGKGKRIYPIIVAGEPGDPERECFPEALRKKVDADGHLTNELEEPIAADAREIGDGKDLALQKIVAGLLGVDLDELRKRDAIEAKKRQRRIQMIAAAMALLAVLAGIGAIVAWQQRNAAVAAQNEALIARNEAVTAKNQAIAAKNQAVAARELAEDRRKDAERRYDQALNSTLRLVTTVASLRTLTENIPFQMSQIQGKGENNDFMNFLQTAKDPNVVWLRLTDVLLSYEHDLPPELRRYQAQIREKQLSLQWVKHAEVVMGNVMRGVQDKTPYSVQMEKIKQRIVALGGEPAKECPPIASATSNEPASNAPAASDPRQQTPMQNIDSPMMQQPLSPQAMRTPPC